MLFKPGWFCESATSPGLRYCNQSGSPSKTGYEGGSCQWRKQSFAVGRNAPEQPAIFQLGVFFKMNAVHEHGKSGALFLPRAYALGDGLDGVVGSPLLAFAGVVAVAMFKLEKKSGHAQRAKRTGERLVTGGSQFGGIEEFSFHQLPFV